MAVKKASGFEAEDFVAGIPSASILGILGGVGGTIAVNIGFIPPVLGVIATPLAIGGLVFVSELVKVAYENKNSD